MAIPQLLRALLRRLVPACLLLPLTLVPLGVLSGCGISSVMPVPDGFTPLEPINKAALPAATAADLHPETMNTVKEKDASDGSSWAYGEGYIHAPIATVWTALKDPDVTVDRRQLTKWTVTMSDFDASSDRSYQVHLYTNSSPSVDYVIEWRERVMAGTAAAPITVFGRDDLVQSAVIFGITLMTVLSDTVVLDTVDANTTSFAVIRHRDTVQGTPDDAQQYIQDLYNSVVARVHGMPLPTY